MTLLWNALIIDSFRYFLLSSSYCSSEIPYFTFLKLWGRKVRKLIVECGLLLESNYKSHVLSANQTTRFFIEMMAESTEPRASKPLHSPFPAGWGVGREGVERSCPKVLLPHQGAAPA